MEGGGDLVSAGKIRKSTETIKKLLDDKDIGGQFDTHYGYINKCSSDIGTGRRPTSLVLLAELFARQDWPTIQTYSINVN